jgi:hypothetical protein
MDLTILSQALRTMSHPREAFVLLNYKHDALHVLHAQVHYHYIIILVNVNVRQHPTDTMVCGRLILSIYLSICLSVCLSIYLSIYLFICLSVCLYIYLSIYDSTTLLLDLGCFFSFLNYTQPV